MIQENKNRNLIDFIVVLVLKQVIVHNYEYVFRVYFFESKVENAGDAAHRQGFLKPEHEKRSRNSDSMIMDNYLN